MKKHLGRLAPVLLALCMALGMAAARADGIPTATQTYDAERGWEGTLEIDKYTTIQLSNLTHDLSEGTENGSPIRICGGATVNIVIDGEVVLKANPTNISAGIEVEQGSTVCLYATEGASLTVTGGKYSAGIGGIGYNSASAENPKAGTVRIYSGTITATGGDRGAGIGSGYHSSASSIVILGGRVTAHGTGCGAGIGSGYGTSGGSAVATGVGFYDGGSITISGGVVQAYGSDFAAGIGGGFGASSGNIDICENAVVHAEGAVGGAGIGTGRGVSRLTNYDTGHARLSVRIRDSAVVTAAAGKDPRESMQPVGGAGIGLGREWEACGSVSIEDSASVTASAEFHAAAIGGSWRVVRVTAENLENPENVVRPDVAIATTATVVAENDGFVPAVYGKDLFSYRREAVFRVAGGSWNDGASEDVVRVFEGLQGGDFALKTLSADQIPEAGAKPDAFSVARGAWDVVPEAGTEITDDLLFVYTYVPKEPVTIVKAPAGKILIVSGAPTELVSAGEAVGGTMQYALGANDTDPPADALYADSVPRATDAGFYYVWYRVLGDPEHLNRDPEPMVSRLVPAFGEADLTLPEDIVTVGANAFVGAAGVRSVDARHCAEIGAGAFRGCAALGRIRLPADCSVGEEAFDEREILVYAPAGGTTETWCGEHENLIFVEEKTGA